MTSILIYGRTNAGKTTQLGVLVEDIYVQTGKISRLYTSDMGGYASLQPYVDLGILEVVPVLDTDPFIYAHQTALGNIRDANGRWINDPNIDKLGVVAYDSTTADGELMLENLAERTANGLNLAGGGNANLDVKGDGVTLKIGSNNMAHYGVIQSRIRKEIWTSKRLPVDYVVWTAGVSQDADDVSTTKIVGPAAVGQALTGAMPRWFDLTFRLDVLAAKGAIPEKHQLYLGTHTDVTLKNAAGLGNVRIPLSKHKLPKTVIEPANIVEALAIIKEAGECAKQEIMERMKA